MTLTSPPTRHRMVAIALLVSGVSLPVAATEFRFTGIAESEAGQVLYREHHNVKGQCDNGLFQPQQHSVAYRKDSNETPFATKDLAYTSSEIRPKVDFFQPGFDESMKIRYPRPQELVVTWNTPGTGSDIKTFEVPFTDSTVVDAGFDNFVRRHWQSVLSGKSVEFRFLGPTRGEHYGFVLEPVSSDKVNAEHEVQIRPTGMVLRFLVDPIVLGYNKSGALTDYYGLTNIRKNQDENYTAHIRYSVDSYPECELTR